MHDEAGHKICISRSSSDLDLSKVLLQRGFLLLYLENGSQIWSQEEAPAHSLTLSAAHAEQQRDQPSRIPIERLLGAEEV